MTEMLSAGYTALTAGMTWITSNTFLSGGLGVLAAVSVAIGLVSVAIGVFRGR